MPRMKRTRKRSAKNVLFKPNKSLKTEAGCSAVIDEGEGNVYDLNTNKNNTDSTQSQINETSHKHQLKKISNNRTGSTNMQPIHVPQAKGRNKHHKKSSLYRQEKRLMETQEQRIERLRKQREYMREKRAAEFKDNPDRLKADRLRKKVDREIETECQRRSRLDTVKVKVTQQHQRETDIQRKSRLRKVKLNVTQQRERESDIQKKARLRKVKLTVTQQRERESNIQRKNRLERVNLKEKQQRERESDIQKKARLRRVKLTVTQQRERESDIQRKNRLERVKLKEKQQRERESDIQKKARLRRVKLTVTQQRERESDIQRKNRLERVKLKEKQQRERESNIQKKARLRKIKLTVTQQRERESDIQRKNRLQRVKLNMKKRRQHESPLQRNYRLKSVKRAMTHLRQRETATARKERLSNVRKKMADLRQRQEKIRAENVVDAFLKSVKDGPDYVCCCCHRLMYRVTVVELKDTKYTKCSKSLLKSVLAFRRQSRHDKEWICRTCHVTLKRGKMPAQSKANNLSLLPQPKELSDLNCLELRLICQRIPFMKMVGLPRGRQHGIHGPAVNVPSKLDTVCTLLPRLPRQSELIPLKFKRRRAYSSHYMFEYVSPEKVLAALRYLKQNNALYADTQINERWVAEAESDDEDLWRGLTEAHNDSQEQCKSTPAFSSTNNKTDEQHKQTEDNAGVQNDQRQQISSEKQNKCNQSPSVAPQKNKFKRTRSSKSQNKKNETTLQTNKTARKTSQSHNSVLAVISDGNHYSRLKNMAKAQKMKIVDVAGDGNCLFAAICVQLDRLGVSSLQHEQLRKELCRFMKENPEFYKDFVCARVLSADASNADTEAPTREDYAIAVIDDGGTRTEIQWMRYLDSLEHEAAWGDNICAQAIADMYSLKIIIHTTANINIPNEVCTRFEPTYEFHLGLMAQSHYVAFVPDTGVDINTDNNTNLHQPEQCQEISGSHRSNSFEQVGEEVEFTEPQISQDKCSNTHSSDESDSDDNAAEEDHEYAVQISKIRGLPYESYMAAENPETVGNTLSLAPAEGQKPIPLLSENFEELSNPDKYPDGKNGLSAKRPVKITPRRYFNQRLLDVDGRFGKSIEYLLSCQYATESAQIHGDINHFVYRRASSKQFQGLRLTAGTVQKVEVMNEMLKADQLYKVMGNIRGSPAYFQKLFYDVLGMIRQLGIPCWFFTISSADMQWSDMLQTIARQYGTILSDDDVKKLSFEERCKWLRSNPVTAARHFQYRLERFFKDVLMSSAAPLGEIVDYVIRIEFQQRGSPHAHCLLWVKNAPTITDKPDPVRDVAVATFIDKHVTCSLPDDDPHLCELVTKLQRHSHSSYCRKKDKKTCRFHFPKPPSPRTLIAREPQDPETKKNVLENAATILQSVRDTMEKEDTPQDISLSDLCAKSGTNQMSYINALLVSKKQKTVVQKREPAERCVNAYNAVCIKAWQANMDVQFVLDAYACVMYIAAYMTKNESGMAELLKQACKEKNDKDIKSMLRRVGSVFLNHRQVSSQEGTYRAMSLPMKKLSRRVVFVNTDPEDARVAVLKTKEQLATKDDDDEDIFQSNILDRYQHRPPSLEAICLAQFAATYTTSYRNDDVDDTVPDVLGEDEPDEKYLPHRIKLTDGRGRMHSCRRECVIRFRKYNRQKDGENYYRAKLMLYLPWRNENRDLLGQYHSFEEHYKAVEQVLLQNEAKYTLVTEAMDDMVQQNIENGPPEHIWADLAPNTENVNRVDLELDPEILTNMAQEDLDANADMFRQSAAATQTTDLMARFEQVNINILALPEYREMMRGLNKKQREIVFFNRQWCKNAVVAIKAGKKPEPYRVFISGPGGTGKSFIVKLLQSDTKRLLSLAGTSKPTDIVTMLTGPTGVSAFNIGGLTIHSALLLRVGKFDKEGLTGDKLHTLRLKLEHLQLMIIDEISMVGSTFLVDIHKRLCEIKGVAEEDVLFGNLNILAMGDLYQLPPVAQSHIYEAPANKMASLYGSLWTEKFLLHELHEIMRQKDDKAFAELLCRLRVNQCTGDDLTLLRSRQVDANAENYPHDILHVFALNKDVDAWNEKKLESVVTHADEIVIIPAVDGKKDCTGLINLDKFEKSERRSDTGGLHSMLKLAVGAKVMLVYNVDTSDGMVNGSLATVAAIIKTEKGKVLTVLVEFDNAHVGRKAIQSSQWKQQYPRAVPIMRHFATFEKGGKKGAQTSRLQFPLTLGFSLTIHKSQGLTMDQIVVSFKSAKSFGKGQAYVALSRVKSLSGLYILDFDEKAIKADKKVEEVMLGMRQNVVKYIPEMSFAACEKPEWITFGHLNINYFLPKLPDLISHQEAGVFECADVFCFTETYLTNHHDVDSFNNKYNYLSFRSDVPGENHHEGLHGVMVCVKSHLHPVELRTITVKGLESKVVMLVDTRSRFVVACVYRPPTLSVDSFLKKMDSLISKLPLGVPTVILGDFNENLISEKKSAVTNFMRYYRFLQCITKPTTDYGTLIDHIYFNRQCEDSSHILTDVYDVYFSDHDAVLLTTDLV